METQYQTIRFRLNGKEVARTIDVRASLTDMLRENYHLTSVKKGCEVGECGACTVLIDGEAFNSCIYLAVWAEGKDIRTVEGLLGEKGELSPIQRSFAEDAAIQCGFCTPGFLMTATEILESGKDITVFTHVQIPAEMDQEQAAAFAGGFTIGVKAQAVQTEHVGANAFEAFQTVNMPIQ